MGDFFPRISFPANSHQVQPVFELIFILPAFVPTLDLVLFCSAFGELLSYEQSDPHSPYFFPIL